MSCPSKERVKHGAKRPQPCPCSPMWPNTLPKPLGAGGSGVRGNIGLCFLLVWAVYIWFFLAFHTSDQWWAPMRRRIDGPCTSPMIWIGLSNSSKSIFCGRSHQFGFRTCLNARAVQKIKRRPQNCKRLHGMVLRCEIL